MHEQSNAMLYYATIAPMYLLRDCHEALLVQLTCELVTQELTSKSAHELVSYLVHEHSLVHALKISLPFVHYGGIMKWISRTSCSKKQIINEGLALSSNKDQQAKLYTCANSFMSS